MKLFKSKIFVIGFLIFLVIGFTPINEAFADDGTIVQSELQKIEDSSTTVAIKNSDKKNVFKKKKKINNKSNKKKKINNKLNKKKRIANKSSKKKIADEDIGPLFEKLLKAKENSMSNGEFKPIFNHPFQAFRDKANSSTSYDFTMSPSTLVKIVGVAVLAYVTYRLVRLAYEVMYPRYDFRPLLPRHNRGPVLQDERRRNNNVLPEVQEQPNDDAPPDPPRPPRAPLPPLPPEEKNAFRLLIAAMMQPFQAKAEEPMLDPAGAIEPPRMALGRIDYQPFKGLKKMDRTYYVIKNNMTKREIYMLGQMSLEARAKKTTRAALQRQRQARREAKIIEYFFDKHPGPPERDDEDEDPGAQAGAQIVNEQVRGGNNGCMVF